DEAPLEKPESARRVGPWREPMPNAIELGHFASGKPQTEASQQGNEVRPMKLIEARPGYRAAPHLIHRRAIPRAPSVGKSIPVDAHAMVASDAPHLARDAAVPVDDGPENVEQERARSRAHGGVAALQNVNRICMTVAKVRR